MALTELKFKGVHPQPPDENHLEAENDVKCNRCDTLYQKLPYWKAKIPKA